MASLEETDQEWCERTFKFLDADQGLIERWRIEGRDSRMEPWKGYGVVYRADSPTKLYEQIRREIYSGGRRMNRVTAWPKGARRQISTRTWSELTYSEVDLEEETSGSQTAFTAQLVAQNQFLFRHATRAQGETMEYLARAVHEAREENERLRKEKLEWFVSLQDLLDRKGEREIKLMREGSITKGVEAVADLVRYKLAPGVIRPGERGSALESALKDLGQSITPEQLERLHGAGILRPEQEAVLLQLVANPQDVEAGAEEETKPSRGALPEKADGRRSIALTPQALRALKMILPEDKYLFVVDVLQALVEEDVERLGEPKETADVTKIGDAEEAE